MNFSLLKSELKQASKYLLPQNIPQILGLIKNQLLFAPFTSYYLYESCKDTIESFISVQGSGNLESLIEYVGFMHSKELFAAGLVHAMIALNHSLSQPSKKSLDTILEKYGQPNTFEKNKVDISSASISAAIVGSMVASQYLSGNQLFDFEIINSATLSKNIFNGLLLYESTQLSYYPLSLFRSFKKVEGNSLREEFQFYSGREIDTKTTTFSQFRHLIRSQPQKALTTYYNLHFNKKINSLPTNDSTLKKKLLYLYGNSPLVSLAQSRTFVDMGEFTHLFREEAKREAESKQDVQTYLLLCLDELLHEGKTESFQKHFEMIHQHKEIQRKLIGKGTSVDVYSYELVDHNDLTAIILAEKESTHHDEIKKRYEFTQLFKDKLYVHQPFYYGRTPEHSFLHELKLTEWLLINYLKNNPDLLQQAYSSLQLLSQDMVNHVHHVVNFVHKFENSSLLQDKKITQTIYQIQNNFENHEKVPFTDFFADNLFYKDGIVGTFDLVDKGKRPSLSDIANLIEFSYPHFTFEELSLQRQHILEGFQEKENIEWNILEKDYLYAATERMISYVDARLEVPQLHHQILPFLTHMGTLFNYFKNEGTQPQLASSQLELVHVLERTF